MDLSAYRKRIPTYDNGKPKSTEEFWNKTIDRLEAYVNDHEPPNAFLKSVLQNDLMVTICSGDNESLSCLKATLHVIHQEFPGRCHGSEQKYKAWCASAKNKPEPVEIPEDLNVPEFLKVWNEWVSYRLKKRLPVTVRALTRNLATCDQMGADRAIDALRFSIDSKYQSIYEDKKTSKASTERESGPLFRNDDEEIKERRARRAAKGVEAVEKRMKGDEPWKEATERHDETSNGKG